MKTIKHSERFDLARIYALNVRDIYDMYIAQSRVVAKRIKLGKSVDVAHLAKSSMLEKLAYKLNAYSMGYDSVRCVESGDMLALAQMVITEANEIISFES